MRPQHLILSAGAVVTAAALLSGCTTVTNTSTSVATGTNAAGQVTTRTTTSAGTTVVPAVPDVTYTMADVAKHNTAEDCWTAINGTVYDVTAFVAKHEGGKKAIQGLCGKDGTSEFKDKHEKDAAPNARLATFVKGVLKK